MSAEREHWLNKTTIPFFALREKAWEAEEEDQESEVIPSYEVPAQHELHVTL